MFGNSNIGHWFSGSRRDRELNDIRATWNEVQTVWRASPIGQAATRNPLDELATGIVKETWERAGHVPTLSIVLKLGDVAEALLADECIGDIKPRWDAIDDDVSIAVEFREVLAKRRRYAADFSHVHGVMKRQLLAAYVAFLGALPDSAFHWPDKDEGSFEVPVIELVESPANLVQELLRAFYDHEALRLGLFAELRAVLKRNVLMASGLSPDLEVIERPERLVYPTDQTNKTPAELADIYLAGTPLRDLLDVPVPFTVPESVRFEHCHIVGGTGHGKTQLMQRMIHGDLITAARQKRSVVVIDSQGDLINKLVRLDLFDPTRPRNLADRLILIDPSDVEFPASLNLFDAHLDRLESYRPVDRERVLNGVVETYEAFFGDLLGAELTQKQGVVFKYLARLMLTIPGATIHTLMQLMEDGRPFRPHMAKLQGSTRFFFEREFFDPSFAQTKKQILKRLWGVLSTPAFERMFAQTENKLDLYGALNEGKIILVNTAKDLLKDEGSQLFGRFFIRLLTQAALERSTIPEGKRTPTFVYVDEAQEYFDDRIETILNQARKYRVSLTLAHQTLDQLTPRLRAALHANTSMKCAGGVSAKDARALDDELHTSAAFIESMKRRGDRTQFALWIKHQTPRAIRLSVPLGHLERQPTLTEETYDALLAANRLRYCGTLDDILTREPAPWPEDQTPRGPRQKEKPEPPRVPDANAEAQERPEPELPPTRKETPPPEPTADEQAPVKPPEDRLLRKSRPPIEDRELGKGGPKHRYLQSLVKGLAEARGLKATIEAPLRGGAGQVDVLLTREGLSVAVEVSVTTPAEQEQENVRKCLAAGYNRVALVLAKSIKTQKRFREAVLASVAPADRERLTILSPEEVPDYIAGIAEPPPATETVIHGYKVRVTRKQVSPEEAKERRDKLAKMVAESLGQQPG